MTKEEINQKPFPRTILNYVRKKLFFQNSNLWRWLIFPMTPTVFQTWQTIGKRSTWKALSVVGEKYKPRLKYSFSCNKTFEDTFFILRVPLVAFHDYIPLVLTSQIWLNLMTPIMTMCDTISGWRQCTIQLVWLPRWSFPQRWMKNYMMFAFYVLHPKFYLHHTITIE